MPETRVRSLGQEDPPEKELATHPSILAWRISWTEEPGGATVAESVTTKQPEHPGRARQARSQSPTDVRPRVPLERCRGGRGSTVLRSPRDHSPPPSRGSGRTPRTRTRAHAQSRTRRAALGLPGSAGEGWGSPRLPDAKLRPKL